MSADAQKCDHPGFEANVVVSRMSTKDGGPIEAYMADVTIKCDVCGQPFRFKGMDLGVSFYRPMMGPNGEEARLPIEPSDDTLQGTSARVEMLPPSGRGGVRS